MSWLSRVILFAVVSVAVATAVVFAGRRSPQPPVAKFPSVIDLGASKLGQVAVGRFNVINAGGSPLKLNNFVTSCTCAGLEIERDGEFHRIRSLEVPGYSEVPLVVRVSASGKPGRKQEVSVGFSTNDPKHPAGLIRVIIPQVVGGTISAPIAAHFGAVSLGQPRSLSLRLYNADEPAQAIATVRSSNPSQVAVKFAPVDRPEGAPAEAPVGRELGTITATALAEVPGSLHGFIEIEYADKSIKPDRIDVSGVVDSPWICIPDTLLLPRYEKGEAATLGRLAVSWRNGQPATIEVESLPSGVSAVVGETVGDDGSISVAITSHLSSDPDKSLRLRITAPDGQKAIVTVPVIIVDGIDQ